MQREQKTPISQRDGGWPCGGTVEPESSRGARSTAALEGVEKDGAGALLEQVLSRNNMNAAYKRVKQNGGAAGVDGMTVDKMLPYLKEHGNELVKNLRNGQYKPQPVRRVEIPKPAGGVRMLGVPTVIDRMIQQAIVQILQPIFEKTFSESSYGFRPGRSAQQAIKRAKEYYEQGYTRVVDIDLAKYFDTVNHDLLIGMVRKEVKDESLVGLIRRYLKSGVMSNGVVSSTEEGTPQGGNLSPLLSNIYLTSFDRMLEGRGHRFVRYADDCNIYVRSQRAAERVMVSCARHLEGKLKLKVNREKSSAGSPLKLKFLGYSLYKAGKKTGIRPHEKTLERFKNKVREITSRKRPKTVGAMLDELKTYSRGWLGYYAIADMEKKVAALNEWIRRRIRQFLWKQWKKTNARHDSLVRLGISNGQAWEWANTRLGYWRVAGSWILARSLTNEYLASLGYDDLANRYGVLHQCH